jgi:signal recognition particle receptor subunit beta
LQGRALYKNYIANTHALIYVIDSNDTERISVVCDELHRCLEENELKNCPLLIIANKQDLPNSMSVQEVANKVRFNDIKVRQKHIIGAIVKTGQGIDESLEWISNVLTKQECEHGILAPLIETNEDAKMFAQMVSDSSLSFCLKSCSSNILNFFKF